MRVKLARFGYRRKLWSATQLSVKKQSWKRLKNFPTKASKAIWVELRLQWLFSTFGRPARPNAQLRFVFLLAIVQIVKPEIALTENDSLIIWAESRKPNVNGSPDSCGFRRSIESDKVYDCLIVWFLCRCSACRPSEHGAGCTLEFRQRLGEWNFRLRVFEGSAEKGTAGESRRFSPQHESLGDGRIHACVGSFAHATRRHFNEWRFTSRSEVKINSEMSSADTKVSFPPRFGIDSRLSASENMEN